MGKLSCGSALMGLLMGIGTAAQPLVKTGDCPTLSRSKAPAEDHWDVFSIRPNPPSDFPLNTVQNPLTAAQSLNCTETQPGLRVELWASEEMPGNIAYLQDFTFDERGRLWAVEPKSYPNIIRPYGNSVTDPKFVGGTDRIVILEDTDGDGVMDKFKVFRDGLNLPQGIEVVNGGVVVAMGPYLAFFPNNNDVAGTPQILWNGMGPTGNYDTHGGINSLMYGLDNWVYGHTGYNACKAGTVDCGKGRVWRFHHTAIGNAKTEFEIWSQGPANAHGIGQMEDGQLFQSGATGTPHITFPARQGSYAIDIRTGSPNNVYYPITGDRYLWEGSTGKNAQGWFTSMTTAVSGLQFYTSRLFPRKYWNRFAFTCEGASKLCNQDSLVVSMNGANSGSGWKAIRLPGPQRSNIIASKDAWVAPLLAKTGPDGALWVLDWYNYLFLHNPASPSGAGNAWINTLREKTRSRIYRITPDNGAREPVLNLTGATTAQLVATFSNPNLHWRLQAQRLLIGKGYTAELGDLLEKILTTDKSVDAVDNNPAVVHALWTLAGLGRFEMAGESGRWNPILSKLLLHPAVGVRRNALKAMPRTPAMAQAISDRCSVNDPHGHVRLQALEALSGIAGKPAGMTAMYTAYRDVDTTAAGAFAHAGIPAAAEKPCSPQIEAASTGFRREKQPQPRHDLRFTLLPGGFALHPHGQLVSGMLTVYDIGGRIAFRSGYDAASARWSQPLAQGLKGSVYAYEFLGEDGTWLNGRISSIPSRF